MGHRGFRGRADLLRALADVHGADADAFSQEDMADLAALLDLHPQPPAPGDNIRIDGGDPDERPMGGDQPVIAPPPKPKPQPRRRPPLQARFFVVLEASELPATESPSSATSLTPLTAAECGPLNPGEPPPIPPLVPRTRLWPALRRSLSLARSGGVDVPALTRRLSRAESIRRLPHATRHRTGGEVWIVFDVAPRLIPYEQDFANIIDEVRRLLGVANVRLWLVSEVPDAVLSVQRGRAKAEAVVGGMPVPPAGTPVLILGDLGLLAREGILASSWVAFCRRMAVGGARPVAWVPASPQSIPREAARYASVHCLGAGDLRPLKYQHCVAQPKAPDDALRRLLTRIACAVRVEPALLRSLRLMSPDTAAEPGLEALVWAHPTDVRAGYRFCEIAPSALVSYRAAFAALRADKNGRAEQDEILRQMLAWHAYRGRSTIALESLIWHAHADRLPDEFKLAVEYAGEWIGRAGLSIDGPGDVAGYARDLFARQGGDTRLMADQSERFASLWACSGSDSIPVGLAPADVAAAWEGMTGNTDQRDYVIVQQRDRLFLEARELRQSQVPEGLAPMPWPVVTIAGGFEWSRSDGAIRQWFEPGLKPLELPLGEGAEGCTFALVSGGRRWDLGLLQRPSWAEEWGRDGRGHYALAPSPIGEPVKLRWLIVQWNPGMSEGPVKIFAGKGFRASGQDLPGGIRLGADLQYGLYLDVPLGSSTLRFRWIEPGEFLMGSPEDEAGRFDNEGPRHVVRLTEGFWLAETACSQLVWASVMGSNPSKFSDDLQNPVEQVSWDDVQGFLREVEKRLPGVKADLPTEAEWEYACRAGSETAFSWGDGITPDQANYDTRTSYANGPTGEWRHKTVPVKSYAPNAWGLYQMHGNVLEWCADGRRAYDGAPQVDPRGPAGEEADAPRAVRGGSWFFNPRWLRAAFRSDWLRDWRNDYQGFRFSLRSTSRPEGSAERPPEAAVAPEGPQGKSGAPGRSRSERQSEGSPARRSAGPAAKSGPAKSSKKKRR